MIATSVLIVGGSLAGLTAAAALAVEGRQITIVEQAGDKEPDTPGGGLGVDLDELGGIVGRDPRSGRRPLPVLVDRYRANVAWTDLCAWLLAVAEDRGVRLLRSRSVMSVSVDHGSRPQAALASGEQLQADLVLGADGYRSTVRRYVSPDHQSGTYAGYAIWRSLVPESALGETLGPLDLQVNSSGPYQLVGYAVPGSTLPTGQRERRLSFAWYDPSRNGMLAAAGCVSNGEVMHSLAPAGVSPAVAAELSQEAERHWRHPWPAAVRAATRTRTLFATPISEYVPSRLVRDHVALIGDAAHTMTPMTGAGYQSTLADVRALAYSLDESTDLDDTLARFERRRLSAAASVATRGRRWSADYLRRARPLIA